jgi:hypothetical protein
VATLHPPAATWRKVGVRDGDRLAVRSAPAGWTTEGLGVAASVTRRLSRTPSDVVVAFFTTLAALRRDARALGDAITPDGMVWVAWPRKAAGHTSDLCEQAVRDTLLPLGLVDVKVAMLDEDWSGLKLVWRLEQRPARRAAGAGRDRPVLTRAAGDRSPRAPAR